MKTMYGSSYLPPITGLGSRSVLLRRYSAAMPSSDLGYSVYWTPAPKRQASDAGKAYEA